MRPDRDAAKRALGDKLFAYLMGRPMDLLPDEPDPNEVALARYRLVPRLMKATKGVDISLDFCGRRVAAPLAVGAYAADRLFCEDGVLPIATVCAELGLPLMISEECLTPLDAITARGGDCWLQIRGAGPLARAEALIEAAHAAGARGIVVSLLAPAHIRPGLYPGGVDIGAEIAALGLKTIAARVDATPVAAFPGWGWASLAAAADYAGRLGMSMTAKGVLHAEDAHEAFAAGCRAVMVSNMGVRNLGRWAPAVAQLPAIRARAALPGRSLVLDGGIRVPPDVVVARILGADLATLVRPVVLAQVTGGIEAVRALLAGFVDVITSIVSWMGAETLDDLAPDQVVALS
jgi:isopentenyl diphosphate isomerase/L-lactate dehydrogenase-like FMN-dependent dehydrogenase